MHYLSVYCGYSRRNLLFCHTTWVYAHTFNHLTAVLACMELINWDSQQPFGLVQLERWIQCVCTQHTANYGGEVTHFDCDLVMHVVCGHVSLHVFYAAQLVCPLGMECHPSQHHLWSMLCAYLTYSLTTQLIQHMAIAAKLVITWNTFWSYVHNGITQHICIHLAFHNDHAVIPREMHSMRLP